MRNISFALTTPQFLAGNKTVTRRMGWKFLKARRPPDGHREGPMTEEERKAQIAMLSLQPGEWLEMRYEPLMERIVSVAIIRNGVTESRGFHAHWELRAALGDDMPSQRRPGDDEGFLTDQGRFVSRWEAAAIAYKAGQCSSADRELLSSEVDWHAGRGIETTSKPKKKLYGEQSKRLFRP